MDGCGGGIGVDGCGGGIGVDGCGGIGVDGMATVGGCSGGM